MIPLVRLRSPLVVGASTSSLLLLMTLLGCANHSHVSSTHTFAPLQLPHKTLYFHEGSTKLPELNLLAMDDAMKAFVLRYTEDVHKPGMKVRTLLRALRSPGILDLQYEAFAEGSAIETFHRGTANCLSFANLFVALSRKAGLQANYQWQEVRPQWNRANERVQVGLHVNVVVRMRDGSEVVVDIDPRSSPIVDGSRLLTDTEAEALHLNNVAMAAFADKDLESTWNYLVGALEKAPDLSLLWINLGALYRSNDQHRDAEASYMQALALDSQAHSAMTNLAILYGLEGRDEERAFWLDKIEYHRQTNPYYHAWRGEEAVGEGDLAMALAHYDEAVRLMPSDSALLHARGVIYYQLGDFGAALSNIRQALSVASRRRDIAFYEVEIARIQEEQQRTSIANSQLSRSSSTLCLPGRVDTD
ncbi:MAG: transglutaminase domain-containing protein, partial [Pseudomonadota bacterium]